jgi:putative endonuclease
MPEQGGMWWQDGRKKQFFVYILSNVSMSLYTGVTNNLDRRVAEHMEGRGSSFTSRYHFDRVVYFETYDLAIQAIQREKQIKAWTRQKRIALIRAMNPEWRNVLEIP